MDNALKRREHARLEFKEKISKTFLKTVSAFANYQGGQIIFGVNDDGEVVGLPDPQAAALKIENMINDSIVPRPNYSLAIEGDGTVTLQVNEGDATPYRYDRRAYQRADTASVEVDAIELNRLILAGIHGSFEQLPSANQDLSFSVLEQELVNTLAVSALSEDILKTLNLFVDDSGFNNAAALCADNNNFPGVDVARFGDSINEIRERLTFAGQSVLSQLHEAMAIFRRYYVYEEIDGTVRKEVETIPVTAFREAVANALVHRAWDVAAHTRISLYPDRVEIVSPGGLPPGIGEHEYLHSQLSLLRNPILAGVFFRLGYIEQFGTGIARIMHLYRDAVMQPSFRVAGASIAITLPVVTTGDELTRNQQAVLAALHTGDRLSRAQIQEETGLSKDTTIRVLKQLIAKNLVHTAGAGRAVSYWAGQQGY